MAQKRCSDCGAYLDPEERCDCKQSELAAKPKIMIVGCGGHGSNLLNHLRKSL